MNLQGRTVTKLMQGEDVKLLQEDLRQLGYTISEDEATRQTFGEATHNAVLDFQHRHGLEATGMVDEHTAQLISATMEALQKQPAWTSWVRTSLKTATIRINSPRGGFVGKQFQVQGTASVCMQRTSAEWTGSGIHQETELFYITDVGIGLRVGDATVSPQVWVQDNHVRWSYTVANAAGVVQLTASLSGGVTETTYTYYAHGEPRSTSNYREYSDTHEVQVTVDSDPPVIELKQTIINGYVWGSEPGPWPGPWSWYADLTGTATDGQGSGVQAMQWHRSDGGAGSVQNDSGDWSRWQARVPLPDRRQSYSIWVTARDQIGNEGKSGTVPIDRDTTRPEVIITEPSYSPYPVLWVDGGISVAFEGTARDPGTGVQAVNWQLDDDAVSQAELAGPEARWQMPVRIGRPGVHFVRVWAVDKAGNSSESQAQQIEVRVQE